MCVRSPKKTAVAWRFSKHATDDIFFCFPAVEHLCERLAKRFLVTKVFLCELIADHDVAQVFDLTVAFEEFKGEKRKECGINVRDVVVVKLSAYTEISTAGGVPGYCIDIRKILLEG